MLVNKFINSIFNFKMKYGSIFFFVIFKVFSQIMSPCQAILLLKANTLHLASLPVKSFFLLIFLLTNINHLLYFFLSCFLFQYLRHLISSQCFSLLFYYSWVSLFSKIAYIIIVNIILSILFDVSHSPFIYRIYS